MPPCADGEGKGAAAAPVCQKARHLASNHGWQSVNRGERGGNSTHAGKKGTGFGACPRVAKAPRSRENPFLPAYAGQKFLPPGGCGSLLLLRPSQRACKRQTAAPLVAVSQISIARRSALVNLDSCPNSSSAVSDAGSASLSLCFGCFVRRTRLSFAVLYVSCPSAHVGWTGLFCSFDGFFFVNLLTFEKGVLYCTYEQMLTYQNEGG